MTTKPIHMRINAFKENKADKKRQQMENNPQQSIIGPYQEPLGGRAFAPKAQASRCSGGTWCG